MEIVYDDGSLASISCRPRALRRNIRVLIDHFLEDAFDGGR